MPLHDDYLARLAQWSDVQYAMERFYATAASYPGVAVLELGVRSGNSTSAFLAGAEKAGGHVWSVDIAQPDVPAEWLSCGYWTLTVGDDMAIPLPERQFGVLFIDTSHTYEHTLGELRRFVPLVAQGGTVLLHDTLLGEVPQGPWQVKEALDAFCAETGRAWTEHGGQYGLGEITRPNG